MLEGKEIKERPLFWHYPHYGNQGGEPVSIMRKANYKIIHYWEDGHTELYDLATDLGETKDLSAQNKTLVGQMKQELTDWLEDMDTQYAEVDTLWDEAAWKQRLADHKNKLMPRLERQRKAMLSTDWRPNEDWWGSEPVTGRQ